MRTVVTMIGAPLLFRLIAELEESDETLVAGVVDAIVRGFAPT
ncbi:hypothetical protein ACL02S_06900 [Nocardia sp. 004]